MQNAGRGQAVLSLSSSFTDLGLSGCTFLPLHQLPWSFPPIPMTKKKKKHHQQKNQTHPTTKKSKPTKKKKITKKQNPQDNQPHTRPTPRRAFPSCLTGLWHLPWPHSKRGPLLALPDRSQEGSQDHLSPQHCHVAGVVQLLAQGFAFKPTRCTLHSGLHALGGEKKHPGSSSLVLWNTLTSGAQSLSDTQSSSTQSSGPSDFRAFSKSFHRCFGSVCEEEGGPQRPE